MCSVLTRVLVPPLLTLFRPHHHRLSHLFSRLCNELVQLSGCRRGVTGRDPRPAVITCRLMVLLPMQMMSKGNQLQGDASPVLASSIVE